MFSNAKLEKSLWGKPLRTDVDLIDLSPRGPLNGEFPNEFWKDKNVSYNHVKVFGCKAFVHIPKDERLKLDPQKKCIFLGYGNDEFGYKLSDPI